MLAEQGAWKRRTGEMQKELKVGVKVMVSLCRAAESRLHSVGSGPQG